MRKKIPMVIMDLVTVEQLRERLVDLHAQAQGIQAKADQEGRALNAEELEIFNKIDSEFDAVEADIKRRERLESQGVALREPAPRQTPPTMRQTADPAPGDPTLAQPVSRIEMRSAWERDTNRWGWGSLGEMAMSVVQASKPGAHMLDQRLQIRMEDPGSTITQEGVGADGGFAVPPEFRTDIMEKVMGEEQLITLTDQYNSSRNSMVFPVDETTPHQTSGGILAYWEGEADKIAKSKVALKNTTIRLNKLSALIPVTDETLEDAPMMDSYLRSKVPQKINFKTNLGIVQGTGAGQPLGLLNSPALVTVAKESGQTADTVVAENIVKMYSRMPAASLPNAVWLMNQDVLPQLLLIKLEGSAGGVFPLYVPPGGLSSAPYGTILGRPVRLTEACNTIGDAGDVIFADLTQYMTATKTGGIRVDVSMHIYFDYDSAAFRFILRLAGHPWWSSTIARRSGSNTLSPYVALAARA